MAEVCVVLGSVREGRLGLRVARMILNNLQQLGARATLLDPLEINPPMLQQPLHFMKVRRLGACKYTLMVVILCAGPVPGSTVDA